MVMTSSSPCQARQIVEHIHAKVAARGYGEIRKFERKLALELGFAENTKWLTRMAANGDGKLSVVEACAEELGMSVDALVSEARTRVLPVRKLETPPVAKKLLDASGPGLNDDLIVDLERRIESDPQTAIHYLESVAANASADQRARLFGILISSYRSLMRYSEAIRCFQLGASCAEGTRLADLKLRLRVVYIQLGFRDEALALIEDAIMIFTNAARLERVAEAQVCKASLLAGSDRTRSEAKRIIEHLASYESMLRDNYRATRLYLLSQLSPGKERLDLLTRAFEIWLDSGHLSSAAKTLWLSGMIEKKPQPLEEAIRLFPSFCAVDKTLASIDLSTMLIESGEIERGLSVCREAFIAIDHVRFIPGIERALSELSWIGCSDDGDISTRRLQEVSEAIKLCWARFRESQQSAILQPSG